MIRDAGRRPATCRHSSDPMDPPEIRCQAGVTVVHRNDTLYAIDDGPGIYELDPVSYAWLPRGERLQRPVRFHKSMLVPDNLVNCQRENGL